MWSHGACSAVWCFCEDGDDDHDDAGDGARAVLKMDWSGWRWWRDTVTYIAVAVANAVVEWKKD